MRYLLLLIVLCGCVRAPVPSDLKTLAETQPALLVSSGTNRYVLIHWADDRWHVYPVVEQERQ